MKRRHAYFVAWLMPLPIGYVEAVEAISSMYDSTHQFLDEFETCQLQKDLCYEPCREIFSKQIVQSAATQHLPLPQPRVTLVLRPPV